MREVEVDIAILGGGVVGSVLATLLMQRTTHRVAVIDHALFSDDKRHPGFDARVIALAKNTVDVLAQAGIAVESASGLPIEHIQVSEQGHLGLCELHANDYRIESFGHVVALNQLGVTLQSELTHERLTWIAPAVVSDIKRDTSSVTLHTQDGQTINAKLIVIADGGRSPWAETLGFEQHQDDYGQTAIICNVETSEPHNNWAYERFTPNGPLAFLPFDGGEEGSKTHGYSVVWTLEHARAKQLVSASDREFIQALQATFGYRQGMITKLGARVHYPLALQTKAQLHTHRAVVVGNAAQTLHPIAGQGFNLGLRDVAELASVLSNKTDPGETTALREYAEHRLPDRQRTVTLTDGLVRLFSNETVPLLMARNVGLTAMAHLPSMKRLFVKQSMGF